MRARSLGTSAALLAIGILSVACSPDRGPTYPRFFAEAERNQSAGRYREAADRYDDAANGAIRDRDRVHARYLAGLMRLRAGDVERGMATLAPIATASPANDHSAEAAYRIAATKVSRGEPAFEEVRAVFERFPNSGIARVAFERYLAHLTEKEGGAANALSFLESAAPKVEATGLGEFAAYQIAIQRYKMDDLTAAHDQFVRVATTWPYPKGAYNDDSLFRAAEIDEKQNRFEHALRHLSDLVRVHESSFMVGSYSRPRMSPALFRMGEIYRDKLHDHERAREAFARLYSEFSTSVLRDDAIWNEAQLWSADGYAEKACDRLGKLVKDNPDSRYVPCAAERCPSLRPKVDPKRRCHAYLKRTSDKDPLQREQASDTSETR